MMPDPRVDAYIAKAAPFAQPILSHIRALMHTHCPDGEEAIKWGMPAFTYKGAIVSMIGAFKAHMQFGFWYNEIVTGGTGLEYAGMGSFGKITALNDLPCDDKIAMMIAASKKLIDQGIKPPRVDKPKMPKPEADVPPALSAALAANPDAQLVWDGFAPGQRREYAEWIADAKQDKTREARMAQALDWISEGKTRNWKYRNC